jgi:3-oxoacyl-[acyl-carrier protein] reductase
MAKTIRKSLGALRLPDILVNNAGVYAFGPLESVTAEAWHREFNLNVLGLLLTTQAAVSLFPETEGSVVKIGSRVSTVAPAGSAASKAAVDAITKSLSKELGPHKIREGFISGGLADSPMEKITSP